MKKIVYVIGIILVILSPLASATGSTKKNDQLAGPLSQRGTSNQSLASEPVNPEFVEWVIDDRRGTSDQFYEIESEWTVPSPPPDGTFGWVGIQLDNHPGHPEYRAVWAAVFWGASSIGGGPYWSLAVFWRQWVGPEPWDFAFIGYSVIEDATETGHVVFGEILKDGNDWRVHIFDKARPDVICSDVFTETAFPYQDAAAALLIPSFSSAPAETKLPGTTYFTQLDVLKQDYEPTLPMWIEGQNYYGYGLGVSHGSEPNPYQTWAILHTSHGGTAVGGITIPIDKIDLLAPFIGLASTIIAATVAAAVYVKRVKHRKEKQ